jgi:hypothetical protein
VTPLQAELVPLAVWDVREDRWWLDRKFKSDWLHEAGLPRDVMYRIEFWLLDAPFARIFCFALDDDGRKHWAPGHIRGPHNHDSCHPAFKKPRDVPLDALPPRELW